MFMLARELGMSVRMLTEAMDVRELMEWAALYRLEAGEREHGPARPAPRALTPEELFAKARKIF